MKDRPFIVLEFKNNYSFPIANFIELVYEIYWKVSAHVKHILIVIQNQLLATSIKNLLASDEDLSIHCASVENASEIITSLDIHRPDVLILDNSQTGQDISRYFLMGNDCSDLRVIVANVDDNQLKIYERYQFQLSRSADFIDAIRRDLASMLRNA